MKRIITISLAVMLIMTNLYSQVYHREYYSTPTTLKATSSAFVILDTANTALLFKSDGKRIEVIPIDANTMATISPSAIYSLTPTPIYDIYLTNAFLDDSGDVVLYGYAHDSYMNRGMMLKYDPSSASHFTFMFMQYGSGKEIISGCWGYDPNGVMNYAFVDKDGYLFTTDAGFNLTYHALIPKNGRFQHVSYDAVNKQYLGSGICELYPVKIIFSKIKTDFSSYTCFRYVFNDNYAQVNGKTLHTQYNSTKILLCQDLKDNQNNYLWIADIDIPSGTINDAERAKLDLEPITLVDLAYNENKKNIVVLGRLDYCNGQGKNLFFEENPYKLSYHSLSPIKMSLLSDPNYDMPCLIYDKNYIYLEQILFNKYRKLFFSSGFNVDNAQKIYSIEFNNVASTFSCDREYKSVPEKYIPIFENWETKKEEMANEKVFEMPISYTVLPKEDTLCFNHVGITTTDDGAKSNFDNYTQQTIYLTIQEKSIIFRGEDFYGDIEYKIYDMVGRLVGFGNTVNGESNTISNLTKGVYILNLTDENNTELSKKIVVN